MLSDIAVSRNDFEGALNCLETALIQNPENGDIHYYLAKIYKKINEQEDALFHLTKVLQNKDTLTIAEEVAVREYEQLKKTAFGKEIGA